jgi:hypothetical protein
VTLEASLKENLSKIFDLKVSFDIPGDSREQECVFVQVDKNKSTIKDKKEVAEVRGKLRIFANQSKLPLGFIAKRIALHPTEAKDFFFYDVEEVSGVFNNIVERTLAFVYFYSNQYNPERGIMNEINFTTEVSE